jgi:hypothetical protein
MSDTRLERVMATSSPRVTNLLQAWSDGDDGALDRLIPLVEAELRRLARVYMRRERPDHTLQITALVNEAFLKLFAPMSAQGLAFTDTFVLNNNLQFQAPPPRGLTSTTYIDDFNAVKALGRKTGSTRTDEQTALALFWDGNASVHWNQAANQIALANHLSLSRSNRLLAVLNIAMADTAFTTWSGKRHYGSLSTEVTWRPVTAIPLADTDGNPDTVADPGWVPLIVTPAHPEYPAGHPSQNGAGATVLLSYFDDYQIFVLATPGQPSRSYSSIAQARSDGDNARVWGGMHYPSTVGISDFEGQQIANYVNQNAMQPILKQK